MRDRVFPFLVVFLDLNHLIKLAKDLKNGQPDMFDRLIELKNRKKVLFVAAGTLYLEIFKIGTEHRRLAVHEVAKRLTGGFLLRDYDTIQRLEVTRAVGKHFGLEGYELPMPMVAFTHGFVNFLGQLNLKAPEAAAKEPELYARIEKECWDHVQSGAMFEEMIRANTLPHLDPRLELHDRFVALTERRRREWAGLSFPRREQVYLVPELNRYMGLLEEIIPQMQLRPEHLNKSMFEPLYEPDFVRSSIASLDVWSRMNLFLYHKNLQAKIEWNDLFDLAHLSVSVPYTDVVVCDKKMASVLHASKLDKRYDTRVFDDLSDATHILEELVDSLKSTGTSSSCCRRESGVS
jgi:hypothetical protein